MCQCAGQNHGGADYQRGVIQVRGNNPHRSRSGHPAPPHARARHLSTPGGTALLPSSDRATPGADILSGASRTQRGDARRGLARDHEDRTHHSQAEYAKSRDRNRHEREPVKKRRCRRVVGYQGRERRACQDGHRKQCDDHGERQYQRLSEP